MIEPYPASPPLTNRSQPLVTIRGLTKTFSSRRAWGKDLHPVRALTDVDLDLERGECVAVVGESGSGKTTLARILMRLENADCGSVEFDGVDLLGLRGEPLRRLRRRFQMIFQDPYGSLNPRMTAGAAIAEPLRVHKLVRRQEQAERVAELLEMVGLRADAASRYPHQFSGGQRQRIGIARALATEPQLLVADEPVSALDVSVQAQVLNLLMDLKDQLGLTLLFITHDMAVVRQVADRIAVLYLGRVVEQGPADAVLEQPLHPYTQALLRSVPRPDPTQRSARTVVSGEPPDPANPPSGCAFHPRCPRADSRCQSEQPHNGEAIREVGSGTAVAACFHPGVNENDTNWNFSSPNP